VNGDRTTIDLRWQVPLENGGCNFTGFNLYRDDGNAGAVATEVDPLIINSKPSLTGHTLVLTADDTGKQFRF
jgi:hypothetical protein